MLHVYQYSGHVCCQHRRLGCRLSFLPRVVLLCVSLLLDVFSLTRTLSDVNLVHMCCLDLRWSQEGGGREWGGVGWGGVGWRGEGWGGVGWRGEGGVEWGGGGGGVEGRG